jgi:citrate lyase subunit beta/citryl-CoA lyase
VELGAGEERDGDGFDLLVLDDDGSPVRFLTGHHPAHPHRVPLRLRLGRLGATIAGRSGILRAMPDETQARPRRTCLSVPASSPKMLAKSRELDADQVMLDLEDSVAGADKDEARQNAVAELERGGWGERIVSVRVNGVGTAAGSLDLSALARVAGSIDTVIVPKVETAEQVRSVGSAVGGAGLEALIETARGLASVEEIATATDRLVALVFGPIDMAASLGVPTLDDRPPNEGVDVWHYARMRILVAARSVGAFAIDGPVVALDDDARVRSSAVLARTYGYDGKWVVHPSQIPIVNEAFTPAEAEVQAAQAIVDALDADPHGRGAVGVDGAMIDEASRRAAERILARARATRPSA